MKRSLLLLALFSIALIFVAPQVNASDRDVGLSYVMPADNATPVAIDCQACIKTQEYVVQRLHQDPGDMCGEAEQIFNLSLAPQSGCISDILKFNYSSEWTQLRECQSHNPNRRIVSTSNGGAGY